MKRKEPCDAPLKVWVPRSLFDKIDRRAAAEERSLSTTARRLLEAATAEHDGQSAVA
jgi:hypothetical protein